VLTRALVTLVTAPMEGFHFSGGSSRAKIAETVQTGTRTPQSMQSTGSM